MRFIKTALALFLLVISAPSYANTTYTGKITIIQVVEGSMQFRITLDTAMPTCGLNFAFVEPSSPVYDSYVAQFTTAYNASKTVNIQVTTESSGYCRIFFMSY